MKQKKVITFYCGQSYYFTILFYIEVNVSIFYENVVCRSEQKIQIGKVKEGLYKNLHKDNIDDTTKNYSSCFLLLNMNCVGAIYFLTDIKCTRQYTHMVSLFRIIYILDGWGTLSHWRIIFCKDSLNFNISNKVSVQNYQTSLKKYYIVTFEENQ